MIKLFYISSIILFSTFSYGQTQNYWTKKADFSGLKRERAVAFSANGKGYVGTGVDTSDTVFKDFWSYDPQLNTWTQVADLPGSVRRNAISFSIQDKGYVGTGMNHVQASLGNTLSDFWEYDPTLNTWTAKSSFPGSAGGGVYFATGFTADNKGYICGGKRGPNNYTAEFWEYKPLTDSWAQRQDFPGGVRYQLCSFTVDNLAYVGLGIDQDVYRKDIWQYNPATNAWTEKNDFLGGERGGVCTFSLGQRGFICLGSDGGYKGDLWEYNPFSDAWSIRANYGGSERKNAVAFTLGDSAFVGTGKGISGKKSSVHMYSPYNVLSTQELNSLNSFKIFPTVVQHNINIQSNYQSAIEVKLFNMNGQCVYQQITSDNHIELSSSDYQSGMYFITLSDLSQTLLYSQKIIFTKL